MSAACAGASKEDQQSKLKAHGEADFSFFFFGGGGLGFVAFWV